MSNIIQFLHQCHLTNNILAIKKLHGHLLRTGLLFVWHDFHTQLIATYAACLPKKNDLNNFFKCMNSTNPLHFNVIISDFCQKGFPFLALTAFSFMHKNDVPLDTYALCSTLTASSKVKDVYFGRQIHAHVGKSGWSASVFVGSALIDMYSKLSNVKDAALVFDEIPDKNTVCANALLSGYGEAGLWVQELELVRKMPVLKLKYDHFTLSASLRACTGLSAVEMGRQLHCYLLRTTPDIESDVFLQSALIEMYGKWTGIRPDGIAFLTVISACGHTGQGWRIAEGMGIAKSDLYKGMGNCTISMWGALLSACVDRGNIELGKLAAERALELDPQNAGICIMLSNLYARFGMWDEIGRLRVLINARGLRKDVGCSWVQVTS
ncbi:Tetratricopeptide-like helical domain superfamily [Sesbania bispinosa]|nr:Tetratricopeptide-like helical domain superfamily [Sesbania bispinosa]